MKRLLRATLCLALIIVIFHIAASAAENVDGQNAPQGNLAGKKRPDQGSAAVTFSPRPVYVGAKEGVDPPVDVTPTLAHVEWNDVTFVSADADKFTVTKLDATRKVRLVGKAATGKDGVELQAKADGKIIGKVSVIVVKVDIAFQTAGMGGPKVIPNPDYQRIGVLKGDSITFSAALTPAITLAANEYAWSGEAAGNGSSIAVTFNGLLGTRTGQLQVLGQPGWQQFG